ncbi:P-loop containing nucleoside triphosphate hydrolase protein [Leucogyrophana mollusca]|uniref:P-loop containing nucleoside triphosphate hydrolase protein n=1 Tax=Leucogyrophana mollusca TaxID=85980 RepID=A0ACB8B4Q5_9AGAM|nr:P-loop containing nucleoside triphosphate hydrolase protein [Leucogyrophana mollusca]
MYRKPREANANPESTEKRPPFADIRLGVWRLLVAQEPGFVIPGLGWNISPMKLSILRRAFSDVYAISTPMFLGFILTHFWMAIESPLSLYFSSRLLFYIEHRIVGGAAGSSPPTGLYWATAARIACSVLTGVADWAGERQTIFYGTRIRYHFQERILEANMKRDLPTSQEAETSESPDPSSVFVCVQEACELARSTLSLALQLRLTYQVLSSGAKNAGPVFVALCLLPVLAPAFMQSNLWSKSYIVQAINPHHVRKMALNKLADDDYKQEVLGGGLSEYIMKEYHDACKSLGGVPDAPAYRLYSLSKNALPDIFLSVCSDLPTFYFACLAIFRPAQLSLMHIAVLEQTSMALRYTFSLIVWMIATLPKLITPVESLYRVLAIENQVKDGEMPYPTEGTPNGAGMSINVRNLSFTYPGSKSTKDAINNVSFSIESGQLVVIVGANGSGKSTIIKLLNRTYDPTSGEISIDKHSISSYRLADLRRATANLAQDHHLFPLSIAENIGLGHPAMMADLEKVVECAQLAGAHGFVEKFEEGYKTVLEPASSASLSFGGEDNEDLKKELKKIERKIDVSGGERQRLVASRTFMRLISKNIKFVTVDEPSSALDPQGEYDLFERLRQARQGRTMIFVTHRFGHLTKYADLIICMKDGTVVETGTHGELIGRNGEYAHLYNVQAKAFATESR